MIDAKQVIKAINRKGYILFERTEKPYNLNYIGIRDMGGQWNDQFILMWKYKSGWAFVPWMGTTDPGAYYLKNPMNVKGTAILPEGQHRGLFMSGLHRKAYRALVQAREVGVYRDGDKDSMPELNSLKLDVGWHGINAHRAHKEFEVKTIGKYSGGCQVTHNNDEYNQKIHLADQGFAHWGKTLTYTLLNINDF